MREMKDSGIEWIGLIPKDWQMSKIKFEIKLNGSGTTPPSNVEKFYNNGDKYWIQSGDLYKSDYISNTNKKITDLAIKSCSSLTLYKKPFIVLAMYGASIGNVSISQIDAYTNQACCVLKAKNDNRYMFYFLNIAKERLLLHAFGGTQPNINQIIIKNFEFVKAPSYEQQQIADFLDDKCSKIDSLSANIQKEIETLEEYKKSVITEAVTKGLDPNVEMKDSGIEWIGKIPKSWEIKRLKYVSWLKGRIGWQGLRTEEFLEDATLPYLITGTDFFNGTINWNSCVHISEERFKQDALIHIEENDLLITKDGTIGKLAIVKNCPLKVSLNSGVMIIRQLKTDLYSEMFLYYTLMSNQFIKWFTLSDTGSSTIKHLTQEKFYNFSFAFPSLIEQKEISSYLDTKCSKIDAIISAKQDQLAKLEEYKKSLIYEYVTGKKEVV